MIVFNCTTNIMGGGRKNALLFIKHTLQYTNYVYLIHESLLTEIESEDIDMSKFKIFSKSPAKCRKTRKEIKKLVDKISPSVFYTMSGPSYVNVNCLSVCGISDGFVTHSKFSNFFNFMPVSLSFKTLFTVFYKYIHLHYNDYLLFQTSTALDSFRKRSWFKYKDLLIPNAFDQSLLEVKEIKNFNKNYTEVLIPGSDYWHKGYEQIIPIIVNHYDFLNKYNIKFVLTLPDDSNFLSFIIDSLGCDVYEKFIINKGVYNYRDVNDIYKSADFVFVPSNLETFSAHYLEAFCFSKPLIVTNTDFAVEICANSACVVEKNNSLSFVNSLEILIRDVSKCKALIKSGHQFLDSMYSQQHRARSIHTFLNSFC